MTDKAKTTNDKWMIARGQSSRLTTDRRSSSKVVHRRTGPAKIWATVDMF